MDSAFLSLRNDLIKWENGRLKRMGMPVYARHYARNFTYVILLNPNKAARPIF